MNPHDFMKRVEELGDELPEGVDLVVVLYDPEEDGGIHILEQAHCSSCTARLLMRAAQILMQKATEREQDSQVH